MVRNERPQNFGPRINQRIRVPEVRLIGANNEQIGVIPTAEALRRAQDEGLDLVEVDPRANPPVCRCLDFGKYKYLQKKKEADNRRKTAEVELKEAKLGYKTDPHDIQTLVSRVAGWISEGHKVKISLTLRGREQTHANLGHDKVKGIVEALSGSAKPESPIRQEGKTITVFLVKK